MWTHIDKDINLVSSNGNGEEKMIDVVILTKDSEYVLEECLDSLYDNVPVKRLIVVDGGSKDKTLSILEKYPRVEIVDEKPTCRGVARQIGINKVSTEWFLFVDSDVVLCENWFSKISNGNTLSQRNLGAIWGVDIPSGVKPDSLLGKVFKLIEGRVFEIRGACHDILIRRDAVKDIRIPSYLHTLEDQYIKNWITSKNYKVVVNYDSYCIHYKLPDVLFSRSNMISTLQEFRNLKLMRERMIYAPFFALIWCMYGLRNRNSARG